MEIVAPLPTGAPGARGGTKKHVEEWSRLDQLTGMLEHARVETDHWSSNTSNSRHRYGKIVDSRARNLADGSVQQQQQTKQLEVFQAHIPGGSVQVIRSHTSTSSSWHNSKPILGGKSHLDWPPSLNGSLLPVQHRLNNVEAKLDGFKLHENLVNLNVEKSKANVARLLPSRRPPTRSKLVKTHDEKDDDNNELHTKSYKQNGLDSLSPIETTTTKKFENENSPSNFTALTSPQRTAAAIAAVAASEHRSPSTVTSPLLVHETLSKKKSVSDENLALVDDTEVDSDSWKRNSKNRWSFQYTKSKFKDPTSVDRGLPGTKHELESVLQRVLRNKGDNLLNQLQQNHSKDNESLAIHSNIVKPTIYPKRKSFVTEETLKETKQRLRHLNGFSKFGSPNEISKDNSSSSIGGSSGVDPDDGICTDSRGESDRDDECGKATSVTSDSASSFINSGISSSAIDTSSYKSDEWYDRRKSYGFEPVSNFSLKKTIFSDIKPAPKTNLSTDSGICRSSELELASTSMIRKLTAEAKNHENDCQLRMTDTPQSVSKGADVFELLRKFEKCGGNDAVTTLKASTENSRKTASDLIKRSHTSGVDLWQRPRTPKYDDSAVPSRVTNGSWIRTAKTSPDTLESDASTSSKTSIASATSWSTPTSKTRASDLADTPSVTRGRVLEALESLRQSSNSNAFEPHSQLFRRSNDSQEMDDPVLKRHSIACDDSKYVLSKFSDTDATSRFCDKLLVPHASDQLKTTVVNFKGAGEVPLVIGEATVPGTEVKKPKKVEFSKTEVHFAAAEPGKIKIVETDEKPPPTNLYRRKRRSVSASPKMLGVGSGYTKFGDHEEHKEVADSHESKSRSNRRSSFNAPNSNHSLHTWPGDDSNSAAVTQKNHDFANAFGSTTCDNGLAVTISSMRPGINDIRRASWSLFDKREPNTTPAGYSTKINFGKEGVTVIADTKSRKHSTENLPPKSIDASRDDENFREKLIVRIGECAVGSAKSVAAPCAMVGTKKSVLQENRFINGFRNSIYCHKFNDRLKSTSLIIDTIRKGVPADKKTKDEVAEPGKKSSIPAKPALEPLEQPSTYITEMNELQHRYNRARQNRSHDRGVICKEELTLDTSTTTTSKLKSCGIYNTVPVSKNAHQRSRLPNTDLLLEKALNVFDRLYNASRGDSNSHASHEKCSRAFVEPSKRREQIIKVFQQHRERRASQTSSTPPSPVMHPLISFRHDGNISDDSLKADEEVRSYMSTAALDEYENELAGSWSRRKYLKLVKSHNTIKEDEEILEKSHFKPLRTEEEKVKTVTSSTNVDIKRPKITSVAVNVLREIHPEDSNAATKKFTTVLLNSNGVKKAESTQASLISRAHDSNYSSHHQDLNRSKHKPGEEHIIPLRLVDDHHCKRTYTEPKEDRHVHRTRDSSINKSNSSGAKTDYKPITIIHHGVRLQDKELGNSRRLVHHTSSSSPKKELVGCKPRSRKSVPLPKDPKESCHVISNGSGSLRKKTSVATASGGGRERLFDSGRDSWLNLPKERKPTASSSSTERKEPTKSSKTAQRLRTGDTTSSDVDGKHTSSSHHHSSRLPTASSSRKSRTVGLVDIVGSTETEATDLDLDAGAGITSTTYTDASSEEDTTSRQKAYLRKFSKPLTTISEKSGPHSIDRQDSSKGTTYAKIRSTTTARTTPSAKPSVTRTTSNSSIESRSNSYEFKYPVLKTEERSKRRAARMLQRATSREALMKGGHVSSSEDITSDNDKCNSRVASKLKQTRKVKSTKTSKPEAINQQSTRISAPPRSKPNRNTKDGSTSSRVTRPVP